MSAHSLEPVVVTGIGVLACNGIGREAFWDALTAGRSGIGVINRFDAGDFPCQIAGQLWDFDAADFMTRGEVKRWHSHVHQAVASAKLAIDESEVESAGYAPERIATAFGTSVGTPDEHYLTYREMFETQGWTKVSKWASNASSGHAATANVSARFKLRGPATTVASGCATGIDVMNWGRQQIRSGMADAAVVGATESPLTALTLATACSLGIVSKRNNDPHEAMRPFDRDGDGLVLAEGAVALVLERRDKAVARGARIFAEMAGYGTAAEGSNPLILDKEGRSLARAITLAFDNAGMRPTELDAAHCHGVSLAIYDRSETSAFKTALGDHAYRIPISATKSMIGQAYSVGGLFSVAGALMSITNGVMPPTINLHNPYDECDLDFVPLRPRRNDLESVLVTALSFGGTHSATILRRAS